MGRPKKERKRKDPTYSPTRDDSDVVSNHGSHETESDEEKPVRRRQRTTSEIRVPSPPAGKSVVTADPCKCPLCVVVQRRGGSPIHEQTPLHWKKINNDYEQLFQILYEMDTQRIGNGSQPLCISKPTGVLRCPLCGWEFEKFISSSMLDSPRQKVVRRSETRNHHSF